jgi:beta-galactosidase
MVKKQTICRLLGAVLSLIMITSCTAISTRQELSISENKAYEKSQFPKALNQAGPNLDPVAKGWQELSLDGRWRFQELPFVKNFKNPLDDKGMKTGFFKSEFKDSQWKTKLVPWSWYQSDPDAPKKRDHVIGKLGWYRRSFNVNENQMKNDKHILLDFLRVADETDVWINGQKAGERHSGRFDSFQYDITALVKPGKNVVAVRVYDYVGHTSYQRRHIGGIYEPVRLLTTSGPVYTNRMMLTTLIDTKSVDIQADIVNKTQKALELKLTAKIANWKGDDVIVKKELPKIKLAPGQKWTELGKIKIPNPVYWTPENPHLYTLTLTDSKENVVGMERFGFRDFKAKGEWLYLNGKKFKPRMYTFSLMRRIAILKNKDSEMEKLLRLFKSLGINMIRPHSGSGPLPETFFNLCDEIGMLVYFDWSGINYHSAFDKPWKKSLPEMWPSFNSFIRDYYSHPSICMWSFGNEIYEGHHNLWFSDDLDKLYGQVKKLDRQNRPICTSTGRQTKEAMRSGVIKERTDVLDDHQYRGCYCGSWQANIKHINDYAKIAEKYYKSKKPKVNAEYGVPGDNVRYRGITFKKLWPAFQLDPSTAEFKNKYISFVKSSKPEIGGYLRLKMNYCSPREYLDEKIIRRRFATHYFKRPVEIYRRAGVKCIGGHTNTQWYDIIRLGKGGNTLSFYGKPGPIPQEETWFDMPLREELKRLYNPTLVSAGVFNEHPMPGSKQKVEVFVTNDLNDAADFSVVAQLRLGNSESIKIADVKFDKIKGMEQKSKQIEYTVPKVKGRKRGQIELYLFKNGKRVGDNYYPVTVVDNSTKVIASEKVALYDVADKMFRGLGTDTTFAVLQNLGFKTDTIDNFSNLDKYKYLIIGANSFDKKLIDASEKIYEWIKKGGKLLCFEQSLCGKVPFFPNYSVTAGSPSTLVSLTVPDHPAFKKLKQEDFDTWAGHDGLMYEYALSPLDEGLIAVAPAGAWKDTDSVKSILCDAKVGKGEAIFSQIAATKRVKTDSVAREYLRNLLQYFLTKGVPRYALTLPEKNFAKVVYVEDKDAYPIDFSKFVNRGFTDDKAGDKKGGWADFGVGFAGIPTGVTRLQGGVPFKIIDPAENAGKSCLVLKGKKRTYFPEKVIGIPVNAKLNSIYFLHTTMYGKKGEALKYVFHYADGKSREFIASNEHEIPDWWNAKDRSNAVVVFRKGKKGLYMSEFVNPLPKVEIKSMDIISCNGSIPIIIGITGRKRFTSVISGVGEK